MVTQQIAAKILVTDLVKDERSTFSLDILTTQNNYYRIDVSGTLGITIFNMAISDNNVSVIIPQKKKYYKGRNVDKVFAMFFKIPMSQEFISKLIHDQNLAGTTPKGISVNWIKRENETRKVSFGNKNTEIQILFKGEPTLVQYNKNAYQIEAPSHYTLQSIE